jgi:hypothetical protein
MKRKLLLVTLFLCMVPILVFPQMNMLYVSSIGGQGALESDYFIAKFTEWGYELTIIAVADLGVYFPEDLEPYDLMFIDEIVSSSALEPAQFLLEPAVIPIVTTENYAIRANILGWCTNTQATNIGAEPIEIVDGTHPLAAGFATGQLVTVNTGGGSNEDLIPNLPEIPFIPVAKSTSMPDLYVAYGMEPGVTSVNGVEILNRCAIVGFHANGYSAITDDGYKMLKAALEWVTGGGTAVETVAGPDQYSLGQNYPNPFNPETSIAFNLAKSGFTTVTVFNALGQAVSQLVSENLPAGSHHVTFQADHLQTGVYYYKIQSGEFSEMKKMLLLK